MNYFCLQYIACKEWIKNVSVFVSGIYRSGIQNRRSSFEDGVYGTTCPIPPGKNFTYVLQVKDQIGSFYYFPSLAFHKAAGGFGGIRILSRPRIPVPFPDPAGDYTVLIGDWYKSNHTVISHFSLSAFWGNDLILWDCHLVFVSVAYGVLCRRIIKIFNFDTSSLLPAVFLTTVLVGTWKKSTF